MANKYLVDFNIEPMRDGLSSVKLSQKFIPVKYVVTIIILAFMILGCLDRNSILTTDEKIGYDKMLSILVDSSLKSHITLTEEGTTSQGRKIFLVNLNTGNRNGKQTKVFLYGLQHGDEISGRDALIGLIRDIANKPSLLNHSVDLFVLPSLNPDGGEKNERRNGMKVDLNRDHQLLSQIETRILYRITQKILPDIAVDFHEYNRTGSSYTNADLLKWADITMDICNNPLFSKEIYAAGLSWIASQEDAMKKRGINFSRYFVGGAPPDEEIRPSTTDIDDGRNGVGSYGAVSFIVETGVYWSYPDPYFDLNKRITANRILINNLLNDNRFLKISKQLANDSRNAPLPDFIPVNYFWGSCGVKENSVKVMDTENNGSVIKTANMMTDLIVKKTVRRPEAYIIGSNYSEIFTSFLSSHGIEFEIIPEDREFKVEDCYQEEMLLDFDKIHQRYAGRQIVSLDDPIKTIYQRGALLVKLKPGHSSIRAIAHLEPSMIFGLYHWDNFAKTIDETGKMPVSRVTSLNPSE